MVRIHPGLPIPTPGRTADAAATRRRNPPHGGFFAFGAGSCGRGFSPDAAADAAATRRKNPPHCGAFCVWRGILWERASAPMPLFRFPVQRNRSDPNPPSRRMPASPSSVQRALPGGQMGALFTPGQPALRPRQGAHYGAAAYDHTAVINAVRQPVDRWGQIPDPRPGASRLEPRVCRSTAQPSLQRHPSVLLPDRSR